LKHGINPATKPVKRTGLEGTGQRQALLDCLARHGSGTVLMMPTRLLIDRWAMANSLVLMA